MKKLTVNEQEELFAQDCKLINLRYEYSGFTGTEKWAIITELSEEALWDKYPDVISRYTPFILLSMAQGEVISESHRNNDKYEKRSKRTIDVYGYEDDIFEFHLIGCIQDERFTDTITFQINIAFVDQKCVSIRSWVYLIST